jgi:hypothetical protein
MISDSDDEAYDDDDQSPPDFTAQRDILVGRSLTNPYSVNILESVPEYHLQRILGRLRLRQLRFLPHLQNLPNGILLLFGFAGSGKTSLLATIILLLNHSGKKVIGTAPTNVAATNPHIVYKN